MRKLRQWGKEVYTWPHSLEVSFEGIDILLLSSLPHLCDHGLVLGFKLLGHLSLLQEVLLSQFIQSELISLSL